MNDLLNMDVATSKRFGIVYEENEEYHVYQANIFNVTLDDEFVSALQILVVAKTQENAIQFVETSFECEIHSVTPLVDIVAGILRLYEKAYADKGVEDGFQIE